MSREKTTPAAPYRTRLGRLGEAGRWRWLAQATTEAVVRRRRRCTGARADPRRRSSVGFFAARGEVGSKEGAKLRAGKKGKMGREVARRGDAMPDRACWRQWPRRAVTEWRRREEEAELLDAQGIRRDVEEVRERSEEDEERARVLEETRPTVVLVCVGSTWASETARRAAADDPPIGYSREDGAICLALERWHSAALAWLAQCARIRRSYCSVLCARTCWRARCADIGRQPREKEEKEGKSDCPVGSRATGQGKERVV